MRCEEELPTGDMCSGDVVESTEGEWVYFRCDSCETERVRHVLTTSPAARKKALLANAGLPDRFVGLKFEETPDNASALDALRGWLGVYSEERLPAPVLWGEQGRGKTHLLVGLCTRLIREHAASVMFRSVRGLLRELQRFNDEVEVTATWERAKRVDVLVLDDLGAQRLTDWRLEQLAELIDERYERQLPVVFATNFHPEQWDQVLDARTVSRLRGMCMPVELRGVDRRVLGEGERI